MPGKDLHIEHQLQNSQPLIILGMHRSGTSLAVRLLTGLGLHMGNHLSRDAEAVFFQKLNRQIFNTVGVKWGFIDPLVACMKSEQFIKDQTQFLHHKLFRTKRVLSKEIKISEFFGPALWEDVNQNKINPWGWKDPRSTITFPIWMRIFPQAKVLHLLRNGIDVAISTHRRSQKQQRNIIKRTFPLDYEPVTLDFNYCFNLWESYVAFVLENKNLIPDEQYLEMRYEDLLSEPEKQLCLIADYIAFPIQENQLKEVVKQVDKSRLDNSKHAAFYQAQIPALASTPLMHKLGYTYIMEN
jgi:hypothetical protein